MKPKGKVLGKGTNLNLTPAQHATTRIAPGWRRFESSAIMGHQRLNRCGLV